MSDESDLTGANVSSNSHPTVYFGTAQDRKHILSFYSPNLVLKVLGTRLPVCGKLLAGEGWGGVSVSKKPG